MSELPGDVKTAINIAIALSDGHPSAALIGKAIELTGYRLAPMDGTAPGVTPKIAPPRWPQPCSKCNKIVNDRAHAEACERTDCPF